MRLRELTTAQIHRGRSTSTLLEGDGVEVIVEKDEGVAPHFTDVPK
jgi:hypothetical protein